MTFTTQCKLCARPVTIELDGEFFDPEKARGLVVCNDCAEDRRFRKKNGRTIAPPPRPYQATFPDP